MPSANNAINTQGATPGIMKPKTSVLASTTTPGVMGGSYNPNQGAIPLGTNKGLISPHPEVKAQTPLKKTTTTDTAGNTTTHEYHTPPKTPEELNAPKTPPAPPLTTSGQAPELAKAGQQTSQEQAAQQGLRRAGEATPLELDAIRRIEQAQGLKNIGSVAPYAEAGLYAGSSSPNPELITQPDLAARAPGTEGLFNALSNIYGSQATQGLLAANTIAGRGLTAAQSGLTGAQTQAERARTAQQGVLSAVAPQQVSPTSVPYLPGANAYGQPASSAYGEGGLANVGGVLQQQEQGAQVQNMIGAYSQAKPLIETAKQQITAANFNASPLALANQLQQYVNSNIVPSGEYANIFNTLSEIATTISPVLGAQGAQTDLKTMIAQNFIPQLLQGKDIGSVLENIERNALAKISAQKSTAQGTPLQVPNAPSSTTGAVTWDNIGD